MKKQFFKLFTLLCAAAMLLSVCAYAADGEADLTRAEAIEEIFALAGSETVAYTGAFQDVAADAECADAVEWAAANGIVYGDGSGSFDPDRAVTCEEFAAMLYRYSLYVAEADVAVASSKEYTGAVSAYAKDAVNWLVGADLADAEALVPGAALSEDEAAEILAAYAANVKEATGEEYYLFAGAWAGSKGNASGIQAFTYDVEAQQLSYIGNFGGYRSMSCVVRDGTLLFACVETKQDDLLVSFRIHKNGYLEKLATVHTLGYSISDLSIDTEHQRLFACNFESSSVSMVQYDENGVMTLNDCYEITDPGSYEIGLGPIDRQDGAYTHCAGMMPDGKHLSLCDMGTDKVYIFEVDFVNGKLIPCPELTVTIDGGDGARHLVYSADGEYAYLNTEMGNSIYAFKVNDDCSMTRLQKLSTLNTTLDNPKKGWCSVVVMSEDGEHLFVGNRGQNNIVGFNICEDGTLRYNGFYDCYGVSPRGLGFGYDDGVLFCSSNTSGTIAVIEYNKATGELGECLQLIENIEGAANVVWGKLS